MKKFVLFLFLLVSISMLYAATYPADGGYYEGYFNNPDGVTLSSGDNVNIGLTVNYQIGALPTYVKIGFAKGDAAFEDNISYYMNFGNTEDTLDKILDKVTISDNPDDVIANGISDSFKIFYAVLHPSEVALRIYLSSPDKADSSLVGSQYGQSMDWALSINGIEEVNSTGTKSYSISFSNSSSLYAYGTSDLKVIVPDYSSNAVDVYQGYICLEVSSK